MIRITANRRQGHIGGGRLRRTGGILCALLLLFAPFADFGQAGAQEKSFLWKVRSEKHSIYILGSIHFLKKESYPLKKSIEQAFDAVSKLVLEIDLQSATAEKTQQLTLEKGLFRDGTTLQQSVDKETYDLAERRARELGIDLRAMNPLKPWLVALTLAAMKLQKLGFDPNYGVDRYLAERAKRNGKSTGGLESLELQIGLLDGLSRRDQEMMLRETLKELDQLDKGVEQLVQFWMKGEVGAVEQWLLAGMREYPEVYAEVIVKRNRRWLPQIEKMIAQGENAMVIVGAADLVGREGVIELLKQLGYTVEQL
ncbi:MAG: TraB/GumN family protein [Deltaproteobacteria bacterium]|nr:TraB/GumN family protein [Deltaproteobacteria bacterium]MDZ4344022.1 TraB/GumN family protein [Candidatus Binatia bacterium]